MEDDDDDNNATAANGVHNAGGGGQGRWANKRSQISKVARMSTDEFRDPARELWERVRADANRKLTVEELKAFQNEKVSYPPSTRKSMMVHMKSNAGARPQVPPSPQDNVSAADVPVAAGGEWSVANAAIANG